MGHGSSLNVIKTPATSCEITIIIIIVLVIIVSLIENAV